MNGNLPSNLKFTNITMHFNVLWLCLCFVLFVTYCYSFESITLTYIIMNALGLNVEALFDNFPSLSLPCWGECCQEPWVNFNEQTLEMDLNNNLYGQHLVQKAVLRSIRGHIRNKNPHKALVLSFHGWTGGGKNYVSSMIANNLFKNGMKSKFVHLYIATRDFPHKSKVPQYKDKLLKEIKEATNLCDRSLFIFDEIDKMPEGIIDAIKPYVDYYDHLDGINFRKNIFLFLSNAGGNDITKVVLNFWKDGKNREEITVKDIEQLINLNAYNEKGGLRRSDIIQKNLIDINIPFLPLERKHVKQCIEYELNLRKERYSNSDVEEIASKFEYYPNDLNLYSKAGCKKVSNKIDNYL